MTYVDIINKLVELYGEPRKISITHFGNAEITYWGKLDWLKIEACFKTNCEIFDFEFSFFSDLAINLKFESALFFNDNSYASISDDGWIVVRNMDLDTVERFHLKGLLQ